jgi:drug/metabolite transporter (DMT)-like permease
MTWFFIALIGPILYALTNFIDKLLLEKYFKDGGVGTLVLISSLISIFVLPFIFLIDNTVFSVGYVQILTLALVGILNVVVIWCYLLALRDEEASIVVVFYQLVPVFGSILGYFILGEVLSQIQLIAMSVIILGTTIISFEIDEENKFKLRKKTIPLMLIAALGWAIESVLFKLVALEENLWRSLFWEHFMMTMVGLLIFVFIRSYRDNFLLAIRNNSRKILSFNVLNEALYITGNIVVAFAYLLAPIGLVLLTESFQPIFVFMLGIFFTLFFPKFATEKIYTKHILQKVMAICITGIGTYLLLK